MNYFFAHRFKKMRITQGYTQIDFAVLLNTSQNTISNWESNRQEPSYRHLNKIANILNVSIDYLFGQDKKTVELYEKEYKKIIEKMKQVINPPIIIPFDHCTNEILFYKKKLKNSKLTEKEKKIINAYIANDLYDMELILLDGDKEKFLNVEPDLILKFSDYEPIIVNNSVYKKEFEQTLINNLKKHK